MVEPIPAHLRSGASVGGPLRLLASTFSSTLLAFPKHGSGTVERAFPALALERSREVALAA
jgi:hypothetical protein